MTIGLQRDNMASVPANRIIPNPFRDLKSFGYVEDKITKLKESMSADGFMSVIPVRESAAQPGFFEQGFGHHRVESARQLWGDSCSILVEVSKRSDEEMMSLLTRENDGVYSLAPSYVLGTAVKLKAKYGAKKDAVMALARDMHLSGQMAADVLKVAYEIQQGTLTPKIGTLSTLLTVRRFVGGLKAAESTYGVGLLPEEQDHIIDKLISLHTPEHQLQLISQYVRNAMATKARKDLSIHKAVKSAEIQSIQRTFESASKRLKKAHKSGAVFDANIADITRIRAALQEAAQLISTIESAHPQRGQEAV